MSFSSSKKMLQQLFPNTPVISLSFSPDMKPQDQINQLLTIINDVNKTDDSQSGTFNDPPKGP